MTMTTMAMQRTTTTTTTSTTMLLFMLVIAIRISCRCRAGVDQAAGQVSTRRQTAVCHSWVYTWPTLCPHLAGSLYHHHHHHYHHRTHHHGARHVCSLLYIVSLWWLRLCLIQPWWTANMNGAPWPKPLSDRTTYELWLMVVADHAPSRGNRTHHLFCFWWLVSDHHHSAMFVGTSIAFFFK